MRVLVAGASGAIGRALVPALLARGHEVAGLVRSEEGGASVADQGAEPLIADALEALAVMACFERFRPDAVAHQLTALTAVVDLRDFDAAFAKTNALRTRGTDNLIAAARHVGVRRFLAQSFCGWPYARVGGPVKTEDDPLDPNPPAAFRRTLAAIHYLEGAVTTAKGTQWDMSAIRRLLRTWDIIKRERRHHRAGTPAQVSDNRQGWRRLVVHSYRRCGERHDCGARGRSARRIQRRRRRAGSCRGMAASARCSGGREASPAFARFSRSPHPAPPPVCHDDRHSRRLEHEVQGHLRLATSLAHMA